VINEVNANLMIVVAEAEEFVERYVCDRQGTFEITDK